MAASTVEAGQKSRLALDRSIVSLTKKKVTLGVAVVALACTLGLVHSAPSETTPKFVKLPGRTSGISLDYPINEGCSEKHLYVSGFACGGVAAGDLNGDSRPDLVFAGTEGSNKIFLNLGDFRFADATKSSGVDERNTWASTPTLIDIDSDGDLDIYFTNYDEPNQLFINNGKAKFKNEAAAYGLDLHDASLAAAFCDYDRDGDLDLYLLTNRYYAPNGLPHPEPTTLTPELRKYFQFVEVQPGKKVLNLVPRTDRLLRNDNGTFVDVSKAAGISADPRHGLAATWWDYNKDGHPDLYVSNDFDDPDSLYHNKGDGTFRDVTSQVLPHTAWFSMGADSTDIDGDGWPDFLAADMSGTNHFKDKTTMGAMGSRIWVTLQDPRQYMRNALYIGTGQGRMMEAAYLAGVADSDWTWAVKFADFDGDARDDLFLSNGMTRNFNNSDISFSKEMFRGKSEWDPYEDSPPRTEQNLAFRNRGDLDFQDVSKQWGLDHVGISYAAATADFDLDGDPDLVVVNMDEEVSLYRNDLTTGRHVSIKLVGEKSNRQGVGALVEAHIGKRIQQRWLRPLSGFKSGDEPRLLFGVDEGEAIDRVVVHWPSGIYQETGRLQAGKRYVLREKATKRPKVRQTSPLFLAHSPLPKAEHNEESFDDFRLQPLLPNKLSSLTPGSAWGDIDGDGDDDFFLGCGRGFMGQMHLNEGQGKFRKLPKWTDTSVQDRGAEDTAPLFFDADGDGDLDLFVASGGVEAPPGHPILSDRLYLNNGKGRFAKRLLPGKPFSTGAACAVDVDRDGDIDLFVGGRVVPGQYPTAPGSRLYLNDGNGAFTDATTSQAPALATTGMVTSALWSDANNDGWPDLLLTQEWGSVALYLNSKGSLRAAPKTAGMSELSGWWNGITGGDFDHDGDIDYAVTNFGLNTKYHASPEHPALIYYGDLDGSGKKRLVEAEFEGSICYPIRGKSCSTRAMPSLANKFGTYQDFALADLPGIYSPQRLAAALKLEANTLVSGVFLNQGPKPDGSVTFLFQPLPRLAQIAPGFGLVAGEFNGDGQTDLIIAQNFFGPQPETGRMDGGLSLLLLGKGDGTFQSQRPSASGIVVTGDAGSLTLSDLNKDGAPDLQFGINGKPVRSFQGTSAGKILAVRLPPLPGTRVTLKDEGRAQTAELYTGGGYLSQSAPLLFFRSPQKEATLQIQWPGGRRTEMTVEPKSTTLTVPLPANK